jgi:uncharacterized protein
MTEAVAIAEFVVRAVWKVLPWFLLSVSLGVLVRALKLDDMIRQAVEARVGLAVVLATAVGAFSPLCSCTIVPVISGLLLSGVPLAPVMSFWVASPTMDPEMFALTVATLGWPLALARLAATLVLSLGAGYLTLALTRSGILSADVLRESIRAPRTRAAAPGLPPLSAPFFAAAIGGGAPRRVSGPEAGPSASLPPISGGSDAGVPGPSRGGDSGSSPSREPAMRPAGTAGGSRNLIASVAPGAASACCGGSAAPAPADGPPSPSSGCAGSAPPTAAAGGPGAGGQVAPSSSCCSAPVVPGAAGWLGERLRAVHWPAAGRDIARQTWRLGRWLLLAFVLQAVIVRHVPQAAIAGVLGEGSPFAVVLAALIGIPLYLNNVSALPIVSGLLAQGMQPGAAIAFLIAGPVTTVPAMAAVWGVVRPRVFVLYFGIALVGAVVFGGLTNLLLG